MEKEKIASWHTAWRPGQGLGSGCYGVDTYTDGQGCYWQERWGGGIALGSEVFGLGKVYGDMGRRLIYGLSPQSGVSEAEIQCLAALYWAGIRDWIDRGIASGSLRWDTGYYQYCRLDVSPYRPEEPNRGRPISETEIGRLVWS